MTTTPREKNYVVVEKRVRPARFTWSPDQLVLDVEKVDEERMPEVAEEPLAKHSVPRRPLARGMSK